jgi:hypothetical protein
MLQARFGTKNTYIEYSLYIDGAKVVDALQDVAKVEN